MARMDPLTGLEDSEDLLYWKANYRCLRDIVLLHGFDIRLGNGNYIDVKDLIEQGAFFNPDKPYRPRNLHLLTGREQQVEAQTKGRVDDSTV